MGNRCVAVPDAAGKITTNQLMNRSTLVALLAGIILTALCFWQLSQLLQEPEMVGQHRPPRTMQQIQTEFQVEEFKIVFALGCGTLGGSCLIIVGIKGLLSLGVRKKETT